MRPPQTRARVPTSRLAHTHPSNPHMPWHVHHYCAVLRAGRRRHDDDDDDGNEAGKPGMQKHHHFAVTAAPRWWCGLVVAFGAGLLHLIE